MWIVNWIYGYTNCLLCANLFPGFFFLCRHFVPTQKAPAVPFTYSLFKFKSKVITYFRICGSLSITVEKEHRKRSFFFAFRREDYYFCSAPKRIHEHWTLHMMKRNVKRAPKCILMWFFPYSNCCSWPDVIDFSACMKSGTRTSSVIIGCLLNSRTGNNTFQSIRIFMFLLSEMNQMKIINNGLSTIHMMYT